MAITNAVAGSIGNVGVNAGVQVGLAMSLLKVVVPVMLLFFIIYVVTTFKYILILRHIGQEGYVKYTEIGLARKVKDKNTTQFKLQRLFKRKDFIPIATERSNAIMKGGKHLIEYWVTEDGSYAPIPAPNDVDSDAIGGFDPVSRAQYVMNERSITKLTETWKQYALPIAALSIMGLVIVSGMIFYGKVAVPLIQQGQQNAATAQELTKLTTEINRLSVNVQRIQTGEIAVPPPQTIS